MRITRREHLAGLASAGLAGAGLSAALPAAAAVPRSLGAIAAAKGILFGTAISAGPSFADARYMAMVARECGVIVAENEMKPYSIGIDLARPDFAPGDRIAAFARTHGQKLRGHTLLWNRDDYMPKALATSDAARSPAALERWLRDYIAMVTRHYGAQVFSWDVVNETVDPGTGDLRSTIFTRALGFDTLRIAYEAAREHAPHAQRVYNDYMSWEAGNEAHRAGVLKLLERFRTANVPVDALGIQSHLGNDGRHDRAQKREWRDFVDAVVAMGYRLLITEFDVNDRDLPRDVAARDAAVAAVARDYLDHMFAYPQLDQLLCWGLSDRYTWLDGFAPRTDGTPQRPTPYDAAMRAKPLRAAIAAALDAAPPRPLTAASGRIG